MAISRFLVALAATISLLAGAVSVASAEPDVSLTGSGWGHGVGLSQYGAKAMGADGVDYRQIIHRYFSDVLLIPLVTAASGTFVATDPAPLLVGLLQHSSTVAFTLESGRARLCFDGGGHCVHTAGPGEDFRFAPDGSGGCVFLRESHVGIPTVIGAPGPCSASVQPTSDQTTINLPYKARSYRHGTLLFRLAGTTGGIHTVYEIGVDDYLKGISEVPESWPSEAIKAQVVVSRSYASRKALDRGDQTSFDQARRDECFCNLRDDTSDQVFRGWTGEVDHPNWVAAVENTAQQVIGYGGTVALGMFSSSSGGNTESYYNVFGGESHPYLVTVTDSAAFADSAENPHKTWAAGYSQSTLSEVFGFDWLSNATVTDRHSSGSARLAQLTGIVDGRPVVKTVTGGEMRFALSLRSTSFDISVTPRFNDVQPYHVFAGEVLGLHELGITNGCTVRDFCPDTAISRAEMAAFLVRAFNLPTVTDVNPYTDDDGHALEAEIGTLYVNGITKGCAPMLFCPERSVSRAEMAMFLVRALNLPPGHSKTGFHDDKEHFFENEISALTASGITSGCTPDAYCPDRLVSRAEMAAFLIRALAL